MAKRQGEFSTKTKRERLKHSGGFCEAVGSIYGLDAGVRCNAPLSRGVDFDHFIDAYTSKDGSFDNCRAVCIACHEYKTAKHDLPKIAKTKRQSDKHKGIRRPKQSIKSAGFPVVEKPEKTGKAKLPPRPLFRSAE